MGMPLLESDLLRTFVHIAESGSFSRAAERVHRTPGAVSMQIKRLETTLGCELFVRSPREVRLTGAGEALLVPARKMLELNESAVARFLAPEVAGIVRFGVHDDIGRTVLPEVLRRFARTHPMVQLDVVSGRSVDMVRELESGTVDLALITAGSEGDGSEDGEVIHREALVWAGLEGGTAAARRPLPLALAAAPCIWRNLALDALEAAAVPARIAYNSGHTAGQEAAVAADLAVSALPASLVKPPLVRLDTRAGLPVLGRYSIVMRIRRDPPPAVAAFARHVRERF